jgi:hypothetical protein
MSLVIGSPTVPCVAAGMASATFWGSRVSTWTVVPPLATAPAIAVPMFPAPMIVTAVKASSSCCWAASSRLLLLQVMYRVNGCSVK